MPLTFLGSRTVRVEDGWVEYNPVPLRRRTAYYLEATFTLNNSLEPFSYYNFGYTFQVDDGSLLTITLPNDYYPDARIHGIFIPDIEEIDRNAEVVFLCRRIPFLANLSNVAEISVSLNIDLDIRI